MYFFTFLNYTEKESLLNNLFFNHFANKMHLEKVFIFILLKNVCFVSVMINTFGGFHGALVSVNENSKVIFFFFKLAQC